MEEEEDEDEGERAGENKMGLGENGSEQFLALLHLNMLVSG